MFDNYPLPWKAVPTDSGGWIDLRDANGKYIVGLLAIQKNKGLVEFIVAAVNACGNVPLELLQTMQVELPDPTEEYDSYPTDDLETYPTSHEFCPKCGESLYYCLECDHCDWKPEEGVDDDPLSQKNLYDRGLDGLLLGSAPF